MAVKDDYKFNLSTLALMFGVHRDTLRKRLQEASVSPVGKRGNAPIYDAADAAQACFAQQTINADSLDPDKLDPKSRKEWYQSENERLKFQESVGDLIPCGEVRDEYAEMVKRVAAFFDSLPDKMERKRLFTPAQLEALESTCDEMRNFLHRELVEMEQ